MAAEAMAQAVMTAILLIGCSVHSSPMEAAEAPAAPIHLEQEAQTAQDADLAEAAVTEDHLLPHRLGEHRLQCQGTYLPEGCHPMAHDGLDRVSTTRHGFGRRTFQRKRR